MTFKKTALRLSTFALAATSLLTVNAFADTLNVNLDLPVQTTSAGSTVSFDATVTAPSTNTGTVNLNSIGETFAAAGFTIDNSSFYGTFPYTLDPGDSFSGLLFTVDVPLDAPTDLYPGVVSISGGSDIGSSDLLGSANFEVDVPNASPSPVPEPGSLLLMMGALPGLGVVMRRKLAAQKA